MFRSSSSPAYSPSRLPFVFPATRNLQPPVRPPLTVSSATLTQCIVPLTITAARGGARLGSAAPPVLKAGTVALPANRRVRAPPEPCKRRPASEARVQTASETGTRDSPSDQECTTPPGRHRYWLQGDLPPGLPTPSRHRPTRSQTPTLVILALRTIERSKIANESYMLVEEGMMRKT